MLRLPLALAAVVLATMPAHAHLDPTENGSFLAGFTHPLFGLDHILAMVAVGLWASMLGGRAVYVVPAAFVGTMAAGFVLALAGLPVGFAELMIAGSVVVLGLLVAGAVNLPVAAGAVVVGLFALFHGHAHGEEMGVATALPYGLGFAIATALLHAVGVGLGMAMASGLGRTAIRALGGATAAAGLFLVFA